MPDRLLDTTYFWHNLTIIDPAIETFHFPFVAEAGDAPVFFLERARPYLGARVLELGAAAGWLRARWEIEDYVGIEQNTFSRPHQYRLRKTAERNGVHLGTRVGAVPAQLAGAAPFDAIICYESFHAFPHDALAVARSPLLREGGALILVDGRAWWPINLDFGALGFERVVTEEVPTSWFDHRKIYDVTFRALERLDQVGESRATLSRVAGPMIDAQVGELLETGVPLSAIRERFPAPELNPELHYGIYVFQKDGAPRDAPSAVSDEPPPFGTFADGWVAGKARLVLEAPAAPTRLRLAGLVPLIDDPAFEAEFVARFDGREIGHERLRLGAFTFERECDARPGRHVLELTFSRTQTLPPPDGRDVGALLSFVGLE